MGDKKLSALDELNATPASDDQIYIRDVSEAAALESKRISISNLTGFIRDLFDNHTVLIAISDNNPVALIIDQQTVLGRLSGENITAIAIGISDNNIVQIDHASVADNDYAKFTAAGLEGHSFQELVNDISGVIKATDVEVSELGAATYDDVQDYINFFGDRTLLTGGEISTNGDGTITVAAGTAWAKETDSDTAVGKFFDFSADNSVALTDEVTNHIYLDYNGGTPQIVVATDPQTHLFKQDHVLIGTAFREGTDVHFHDASPIGIGGVNRSDIHHREEAAVHRVDGIVTSSVGTRNLDITAGVLYEGLSRHTTLPFTTPNSGTADDTEANTLHDADGGFATTDVGKTVHNTTDDTYAVVTAFVDSGQLTLDADIFISGETYDLDSFTYWYFNFDSSVWVEVPGSVQISNTQYNLTTSGTGLATLTAAVKFGVHWVFMEIDGQHFHVVYGQGNYFANEAEEAGVPSLLPNIVTNYCALIAKVIIQKNTDSLTITYPWTTMFTSTLATDHGSLGGLSDDDHGQYVLADGSRALTGNWSIGENGLVLDPALSADGKYSGTVEAGTAGAVLAFGDIVYQVASDAEWELARANVAATSDGKLGICVEAQGAGAGNPTTILLWGKVRADAVFPALSVRRPVYISAATAGDITTTAPTGTTNFVVRIVGYANTADELFFCPDNTYVELA